MGLFSLGVDFYVILLLLYCLKNQWGDNCMVRRNENEKFELEKLNESKFNACKSNSKPNRSELKSEI